MTNVHGESVVLIAKQCHNRIGYLVYANGVQFSILLPHSFEWLAVCISDGDERDVELLFCQVWPICIVSVDRLSCVIIIESCCHRLSSSLRGWSS